jgi:radical SAM protein with 4Fe4S-binding SPASM domain
LVDEGYNEFHLQGGEPFICSNVFQVLDLFEQHDVEYALGSNSLLLNNEKIKKLLTYKGLKMLSISVDGATEKTHEAMRGRNTFEPTLKMMRLAAKWKSSLNSRTILSVNHVLTKINHKEIGGIFTIADRIGFDSVFVFSLSLVGNAAEHKDELFLPEREELQALQEGANVLRKINMARKIKGLNRLMFDIELFPYTWKCRLLKWSKGVTSKATQQMCGSGTSTIYIGIDGTVFPCEGARAFLDRIEREVGPYERPNVQNYTIKEAKQTESFKRIVEFLHDYEHIFTSIEPCNTCEYLRNCSICPLFAIADGEVKKCREEVLICFLF